MKNKFRVGQTVIYRNGETYELGVVTEIRVYDKGICYRVKYHTGDTSALTDEDLLKEITNEESFLIKRKTNKQFYQQNKKDHPEVPEAKDPIYNLAKKIEANLKSFDPLDSIYETLMKE